MFQGDTRMAAEIVEEKQWKQLSDPDKIRSICEKLISKNPAQVWFTNVTLCFFCVSCFPSVAKGLRR